MAHSLLEALAAGVANMDSQTVMAVQSLLDSQSIQQSLPGDDEDMFQCGRCKQDFTNICMFLSHKGQCTAGIMRSNGNQMPHTTQNIGGQMAPLAVSHGQDASGCHTGNIIYTAQSINKQISSNAYMVPLQSFSQGMLLTDDMVTFQTVDPTTAIQLQPIHCGGNPFLSPATSDDRNQAPTSTSYCTYVSSNSYAIDESGCLVQSNSEPDPAVMPESAGIVSHMDLKHVLMPAGNVDLKQMIMAVPSSRDLGANLQYISANTAVISSDGSANVTVSSAGNIMDHRFDSLTSSTPISEMLARQHRFRTSTMNSAAASSTTTTTVATSSSSGPVASPPRTRSLKCQYCDKIFSKNFDLQQHTRSHTGERPFQCVVCGRAFAQKSNVKKHLLTHKVWPQGLSKTLPEQPPGTMIDLPQVASNQLVDAFQQQASEADTRPANDNTSPVTAVSGSVEADHLAAINRCMSENGIQLVTNNNQQQPTKLLLQIKSMPAEDDDNQMTVVVDNSYICQYCNERHQTYYQLKSHMVAHKDEQVYKCVLLSCGESFREVDAFLDHIKLHESQLSYRCHQCNRQFQTLHDLSQHQYTHSMYPNQGPKPGPKYFRCVKCNSKYSTPEALRHHLETTSHNYNCPHCEKTFTCERYLRRHLLTHGTNGDYVCMICSKRFKTEQYLKVHIVIHSSDKPFGCDICKATFNRKDKLKRHMLIHQPVKFYKCPLQNSTGCTKEFSRPDKLKAHLVSHTGMKPFVCRTCGRKFTRRPHLREHERVHARDYRFTCDACGHGFLRQKLFHAHRCSGGGNVAVAAVVPGGVSPTPTSQGPARFVRLLRRKVGRPRKNVGDNNAAVASKSSKDLAGQTAVSDSQVTKAIIPRRGRPSVRKKPASRASSSAGPQKSPTRRPTTKTMSTVDQPTSTSQVGTLVATPLESSSSADGLDNVDENSTIQLTSETIARLENGLLYVIQPLLSIGGNGENNSTTTENMGYQTLQVLGRANIETDASNASTAVLINATTGEVITSAANLASLLNAAGISNAKSLEELTSSLAEIPSK